MNILLVAGLMPPLTGARAIQGGRLLEGLISCGGDVRVFQQPRRNLRRQVGVSLGRRLASRWDGALILGAVAINSPWLTYGIKPTNLSAAWKPDVILSLSTPVDSHIAASALAKRYQCPWVAFFSDPWPLSLAPRPYGGRNFVEHLALPGLTRALTGAAMIAAPTLEVAECMKRVYAPDRGVPLLETFHCAPDVVNDGINAVERDRTLVHAGDLTSERCSPQLISAIKKVCASVDASEPLFHFIGAVDCSFRKQLHSEMAGGQIRFSPRLSSEQCRRVGGRSAGVLVIEADMKSSPFLPSKIADCAAMMSPVLAITSKESALVRICGQDAGFSWVPHDEQMIAGAFIRLLTRPSGQGYTACRFHRDTIAQRVISAFQEQLGVRCSP